MKQLLVPVLIASGMLLASCGSNAGSEEPTPVDPNPIDPEPSDPLEGFPETVELSPDYGEYEDNQTATPVVIHENNGVYAVEGANYSAGDFFGNGVFYDGGMKMEAWGYHNNEMSYFVLYDGSQPDTWVTAPQASSPPSIDLTFEGVYSESVFSDNSVRADNATIRVDADTEIMTVEGPSALEDINLTWEDENNIGYRYYEGDEADPEFLRAYGDVNQGGNTSFVTYLNQDVSGYVLGVR